MGSAVNQRVFDVPGSGGFILTDAQPDALEHFEHEKEIVTYKSEDELKDKAAYYLLNDKPRLAIIEAGHRKVLAKHTYNHRLKELITHMLHRHRPPTSSPS
jgi:spore maturation protein CgeB